jgi:hypothetical protein
MSLSPDLKQRVLASVAEVPAATRAEALKARAMLVSCGVLGAVAIFFLEGGVRLTARPSSLVVLTSLGTAAITAAGAWFLLTRGGSVLGRHVSLLVTAAIVSSMLFVAWRYGVSSFFGKTEAWPERPGFRCLSLGFCLGALPLFAALLSWRRTRSVTPVATGAAFGAGAGLCSAPLLDLWCPVSYMPHLILGHLLPIGLLALVGGILGWWVLRIRWR